MGFIDGVYTTKFYNAPDCIGFASIKVLEFIYGKPWNKYALCLVHSLRPSYIRVSNGGIQCDARIWRVTVFVDGNNLIRNIIQEVEVGLTDDCDYSSDLFDKIGVDDDWV